MFNVNLLLSLLLLGSMLALDEIRRAGWLDRVVSYHKDRFIKNLKKVAPIRVDADIRRAPPGYVDSKDWTYESVDRLLTLIRSNDNNRPVHRQLRRMLGPTRRIMMGMKESMARFPSLMKNEKNEFYYSIEYSSEEEVEEDELEPLPVPDDEVVLVVSNPVEARLPSARISVKLLREILEARARAARVMPTTTRSTIHWVPMNKTQPTTASGIPEEEDGGAEEDSANGTAAEGESTTETATEEN